MSKEWKDNADVVPIVLFMHYQVCDRQIPAFDKNKGPLQALSSLARQERQREKHKRTYTITTRKYTRGDEFAGLELGPFDPEDIDEFVQYAGNDKQWRCKQCVNGRGNVTWNCVLQQAELDGTLFATMSGYDTMSHTFGNNLRGGANEWLLLVSMSGCGACKQLHAEPVWNQFTMNHRVLQVTDTPTNLKKPEFKHALEQVEAYPTLYIMRGNQVHKTMEGVDVIVAHASKQSAAHQLSRSAAEVPRMTRVMNQ